MTTLRPTPDTAILILFCQRSQATAAVIGTACRMTPGDVRARLVTLESMRLASGRYDMSTPPRRVYALTDEGRRAAGISDARVI